MNDKDQEGLDRLVENYKLGFKARYGREVNPKELAEKLRQLIDEKDEDSFRSLFQDLTHNDLYRLLKRTERR